MIKQLMGLKQLRQEKWYHYHDIIECLIGALEAKDAYTKGHSERVAHMAYDIGKQCGLKGAKLEKLHIAGHLHDIGKIGIPDYILRKPGKLLPQEYEMIKTHSQMGYDILIKSKVLKNIADIVLYHHERWDGRGYPHGLKGEDIPFESRILAISDTIDAMTSRRSYKAAVTWEACYKEVKANSGIQFDPEIVIKMDSLWKQWEAQYSINYASHA